jgi:hypothetical protein
MPLGIYSKDIGFPGEKLNSNEFVGLGYSKSYS